MAAHGVAQGGSREDAEVEAGDSGDFAYWTDVGNMGRTWVLLVESIHKSGIVHNSCVSSLFGRRLHAHA